MLSIKKFKIQYLLLFTLILLAGCAPSAPNGYASRSNHPFGQISSGSDKGGFTIVLAQYDFQDRSTNAQVLIARAKKILNTNDVWLLNEPQSLFVNYGHFDRSASQKKLEQQLDRIKKIYPSLQPGPYQFCYIREIPEPDPPAPAEWNLLNQNCAYSLEVATYYNVPEKKYFNRKADAVQAVKNLRNGGDIAFFIHGQKESRVYVGCMPRTVNPAVVQSLRKKYPNHHENGAIIFNIEHDIKGKEYRHPQETALIDIEQLKQSVPF